MAPGGARRRGGVLWGGGPGRGAHGPDEYYLIDSTNPKVQGLDGAVMWFVEYLYELSK